MKNIKIILKNIIIIGMFILTTCSSAFAEQNVTLRVATQLPPTHFMTKSLYRFADSVAEKSKNTINVVVYPSGSAYTDKTINDAIVSGALDMGINTTGRWAQVLPALNVLDLPFMFDDYEHVDRAIDNGLGSLLLREYAKFRVIPLAWIDYDFVHVTNNKKEIKSPLDFQGLRLRTYSKYSTATADALGASHMILRSGDVYANTVNGQLDGTFMGVAAMRSRNYHTIFPYITVMNEAMPEFVLAMNASRFVNLSENQKKAIWISAKEMQDEMRFMVKANQARAINESESLGCKVYYLTNEEREAFRNAVRTVYNKYLQECGEVGQQMIDVIINNRK